VEKRPYETLKFNGKNEPQKFRFPEEKTGFLEA
jgi:hypothetical protein